MAGEEPRYESWVRSQPCARCGVTYGIEAHHALWGTTYNPDEPRPPKAIEGARKGKSQKAHSCFSLPLCLKCHIPGIHRGGGHFAGTTPEEREQWEREQVAIHRNRFAMTAPPPALPEPGRPARARRATGSASREAFLQEVEAWAGNRRLKDHEHQLIHDLVNDLRAAGAGSEF